MKTILSECCVDHEKSPFFLRDSRASETRTSVKITPREQGETRRGERKMRDYRQSPSFSPFYWRNPIGCASLIWKAIRTSHSKISTSAVRGQKLRLCLKSLIFLSPRRVSNFSRGVIFTRARVSLAPLSLRKNGDYS